MTPATLQVTANPASRPYDAANPPFTASYAGFVNNETTNVLTGSPFLGTSAVTNSPVGTYPIIATNGTLAATNYNFVFNDGLLTVTATPPLILGITGAGTTNVVITWSALSNAIYRVQFETNVTSSNWQSLLPDVTATGSTASNLDTNTPSQAALLPRPGARDQICGHAVRRRIFHHQGNQRNNFNHWMDSDVNHGWGMDE